MDKAEIAYKLTVQAWEKFSTSWFTGDDEKSPGKAISDTFNEIYANLKMDD